LVFGGKKTKVPSHALIQLRGDSKARAQHNTNAAKQRDAVFLELQHNFKSAAAKAMLRPSIDAIGAAPIGGSGGLATWTSVTDSVQMFPASEFPASEMVCFVA